THKGMKITSAAFTALVEDLVAALDTFNVPEQEKGELLSVLGPMNKDIVEVP
ncbi:MAG: group 1 truncated hemoglobin, partial [Nitrospira sp.]|nr:group 1 truncated hemoglobin [Nitrospira sp.]